MTIPVAIRPYRPADRAVVRQIACDTADRGQPVESLYSDRELIADLVTRYYTDFEPESSWVAEIDGHVVGYLTAALDSHRHHRIMVRRVAPSAIARSILHGALGRRETWRMLAVLRHNLRRYARRRHASLDGFPAHLHINLLPGFRGQHVGERLMQTFLTRLEEHHVPGVQAAVRADNPAGCAFFARMGFQPVAEYEATLPSRGGVQDVLTLLYGRSCNPSRQPPPRSDGISDRTTDLGLLHTLRRYLTVGIGSATTDLGLYAILTHGAGFDPVIANLISRPCGGLFSFTVNKVWTFKRRELRGTSAQLFRFCVVWLAAYVLSESLVWLLSRQWHWGPLHAKIPAEIVTGIFSFLCLRFWTFRQ